MGKLFKNLKTDDLEESTDRVGGGFEALPTDIYELSIKAMYAGQSEGGAQNVTILGEINSKEYRETVYITNKKGENYFLDKDDKKKKIPLPGFTVIEDICLLTTGDGLSDQDTETKALKVYNPKERKEVLTDVEVISRTIGAKVKVAITRTKQFKQEKGDSGEYKDTDKVITVNNIDKVMSADDDRTVVEYRQEIETAEFAKTWLERFQGKDKDKTTNGPSEGGASGSGRPNPFGNKGASSEGGEPKKSSLFSKKS